MKTPQDMKHDPLHRRALDVAVAVSLLSRLPLPRLPDAAFAHSDRAVWSYPLVGVLLGAIAGLAGMAAATVFPAALAAGLTVALLALLTGAMHEDGLADTADGLWGGTTRDTRLAIMKDSHIGTYGTLALIFSTGLRWSAYAVLIPHGPWPVIAAAALSRAGLPVIMRALPHARNNGLSHSVGRPSLPPVLTAILIASLCAIVCTGFAGLAGLGAAIAVTLLVYTVAKAKIGGQTGDILGASQQISELAILCALILAMHWNDG